MGKLSNFLNLFKHNSQNNSDKPMINEHENINFNFKHSDYDLNQTDSNENANLLKEVKINNYASSDKYSNESDFLNLFKYDPIIDSSKTFNIETALNNNWDKIDTFATNINHQMDFKADLVDGKIPSNQLPEINSTADKITIADTAGNFASGNVEGALSELFQFANNGKTAIQTALSNKGVIVSLEDTFTLLASKITAQMCKFGGTAAVTDVLSGKTFINNSGEILLGTMLNQGTKNASLDAGGSYTIPAGYHNGSGVISANSLASQTIGTATAGYILSSYTAWVDGVKITGTIPNRGAVTQTLETQGGRYTIPAGYHNGSGVVTANINNLVAGNIAKGVNIGGIVGNYENKVIPYTQRYVNGRNFGGTDYHFVACNGNSALLFKTTPNTTIITKTTTTSVDNTQHNNGVRFGAFGNYWIMFKSHGIYYSIDGKNWTLSVNTSCVSTNLGLYQFQGATACIGYTYNNGDYPYLYYTTNGTTWIKSNLSNRTFTESGFIKRVGSDYYVFINNRNVGSNFNYYYKSVGGLGSFTQKINSNSVLIFDIEYYNGKYYGSGQYNNLYESVDGINWVIKKDSNNSILYAKFLKVFNNKLYLVHSGGIHYFDLNTVNTDPTKARTPVLSGDVYDVCVTNGTINVLCYNTISSAYTDMYSLIYSDDGDNWYSAGTLTFYSSSTNFTQVFETPYGLLAIDEYKKIIAVAE